MKKQSGRKNLKPNKFIFESLYYNNDTKAEDLAKNYNVSKQTIYNWAYQFRKTQDNDN